MRVTTAYCRHRAWWSLLLIVVSAAGLSASPAPTQKPRSGNSRTQVIGYFTENGAKSGRYTVKDVATSCAAALLTTLDYAFGRVDGDQCQIADRETALDHAYGAAESVDGTADPVDANRLRGAFHQLQELKRRYPKLKIVISFGGWGQSQGFPSAVQPDHLREFVRSCVHTFIEGYFAPGIHAPGIFDGIDIDWEYPVEGGVTSGRPDDTKNFTAMAAEFRRQLDAIRPGLLLTAALPAEAKLYKNFELKKISRTMNDLSIMAYDLHWNSEPMSNLHSPLFHDPADPSKAPMDIRFGDYAVQGFLQAGVPARKIVLGVPFYGKGWTGVKDINHGLYQPATGPTQDWGGYRALKALPDADRQYSSTAVTCTLWSGGNFWSYDCPEALRAKMGYIRSHHLGGVMFWELSQDTDDVELLRALTGR
ncbi:MAG TPA: glycoside hydrolase family 18 protein [Terriglobales bacterium]|jgi:chitinase|nr:glycoside hydrolase family 18 protein [Terriglobales bacterium]